MRYLFSLTLLAGLFVTGWQTPGVCAEDSAQLEQIMKQVTQALDQTDLPTATKQNLLRDLEHNLSKALSGEATADQAATEQSKQGADGDDDSAEARSDRPERPRQQARTAQREERRERREASGDAASQLRRAEEYRAEAERQLRRATQDTPIGPPLRFAIGVMLEPSDEPDSDGQLEITDVFPDSPADEAGLQRGDVILKVEGDELTDAAEVARRVDQAGRENKSLKLEILRDQKTLTVEVKPAARFNFEPPNWIFPAIPGRLGGSGWRDLQWPVSPAGEVEKRITQLEEQLELQKQRLEEHERVLDELRESHAATSSETQDTSQE